MPWIVLHSGALDTRPVVGAPGAPEFTRLEVNAASLGNDTFRLLFTRNLEAPVLAPLAGFKAGTGKVEISADGASYSTLDLTSATGAITSNYIDVTLGGSRTNISKGHSFRISYDSTQGDLRNISDSTAVATYSNSTMFTNNSTIDVLSDIYNGGDGWYDFTEAASTTRLDDAGQNGLSDVNGVGVVTPGVDGTNNSADFDGVNDYLISAGGVYTVPADGKFTIFAYFKMDTLPSVFGNGDAYFVNRWNNNNTRDWLFQVVSTDSDKVYMAGQNSDDQGFRQVFGNTGTITVGKWYGAFGVFDPDDTTNPIKGYIKDITTPGAFTVEGSNYVAPASGDAQCKSVGNSQSLQVGRAANVTAQKGFDGQVGQLVMWERALTQAECTAIVEAFGKPPFFPDTI